MSRIGPDELQDPPRTLAERYANSSNASYLNPGAGASALDVVIAMALATRRHPERVAAVQVDRMVVLQDLRDLHPVIEFYCDALAHYLLRKQRSPMPRQTRGALVTAVVKWKMHQTCDYCGGTGLVAEEGTAGTRTYGCAGCHSTGVAPLARAVPNAHTRLALWLVDEMNSHAKAAYVAARPFLSNKEAPRNA